MKRLLTVLLTVVLGLGCLGVVGCGETEEPVVGLICLHDDNSTYDKNFIDAMKEACENLGIKASQLKIVTGVEESTECYDAAADLAEQGCDVIFADSFGHEKFMIQAAREFTEVEFCHATGTQAHTVNLANFHNAFASIYEGRYLAGVAAGMKLQEMQKNGELTENNYDDNGNIKIGYVGAYTYAEVISGYTSFYLGVKSVVENVVMDVQFTGTWYNEADEKSAAETLIGRGCALLSQHADSMGAPNACETAGVPNVSYNGSTASKCPDTFIVSSRINWVPYFEYIIDAAVNGKTIDTDWSGGLGNSLSDGAVVLTELGTAAAEGTAEAIETARAALKDGTLKVFDTSKFTVTVVTEGKNKLNVNATVDSNGKLLSYMADVNTDADYEADTQVVVDGVFEESVKRSAPYFDIQIDGITLLNAKF